MLCGGTGGGSVVDGAPDRRDPRALGVYLLRVTPTDINPTRTVRGRVQGSEYWAGFPRNAGFATFVRPPTQ